MRHPAMKTSPFHLEELNGVRLLHNQQIKRTMKKNVFSTFILSCVLLSCTEEALFESSEPKSVSTTMPVTIEATLADNGFPATRTGRNPDGTIYWNPSDAINVFFGEDKGRFVSTNTEKAARASFTGSIVISSVMGLNEGEENSNCLWGLYPYDTNARFDGNYITTKLSSKQKGAAGTFADDLYVTLAKNNSFALSFFNVLSGFKFSLTRDDIKSISFYGNNGELLTGTIELGFWEGESVNLLENGKPFVRSVSSNDIYVELAPEETCFEMGKDYYFLFVPKTFSLGFTVILTTIDGKEGVFRYCDRRDFRRNVFVNKSNIDKYLSFEDVESVKILDTKFLAYCLQYFDQNQDGKISVAEAEAVRKIDCSGMGIESLEGISSFPNVEILYCSDNQLKTLDISANEALCVVSCNNNPNLKEIWLDEEQKIDYFTYDKNMVTIKRHFAVPTKVGIPANEVWYTSQNTQAIEPEAVNVGFQMALGAFCPPITSNSYTGGLGKLLMDDLWDEYNSKVANMAFGYNSNLKSIILPEGLFGLEDHAFMHSVYLEGVILPSTVQEIGSYVFDDIWALKTVVIFATTPPTLNGFLYDEGSENYGNMKIYVPQESVNLYKQAEGWCNYANRIYPIAVSETQLMAWDLSGE